MATCKNASPSVMASARETSLFPEESWEKISDKWLRWVTRRSALRGSIDWKSTGHCAGIEPRSATTFKGTCCHNRVPRASRATCQQLGEYK